MKKIILSMTVLALLTACGSGEKKDKKGSDKDTTKTDSTTTTVDNKPKVKDYVYYRDQFKSLKLDGIEVEQYNMYEDTAGKSINMIYRVKNGATVGYDEIIMNTSTCGRMIGDDRAKCDDYTKESFLYFQNNRMPKKDQVTASEYKSGDATFYYGTRKKIKGTMGGSDYNSIVFEAKVGEFVLTGRINVWDLKSDMVKAEEGMKKVADYMVK